MISYESYSLIIIIYLLKEVEDALAILILKKNYILYISIILLTILGNLTSMAQVNQEAEKYLSKMLERKVPYNVKVLDIDFVINNTGSYPPGKITELFMKYLIKNKNIADIGAGCFALGIISAKKGANLVIGVDIGEDPIKCAYDNMKLNGLKENIYIFIKKMELGH